MKLKLTTLAAVLAAAISASAHADDTNYWGAPQTSNGSVNITNYWGIAPAGDSTGATSGTGSDMSSTKWETRSFEEEFLKTSAPATGLESKAAEDDDLASATGVLTRTRSASIDGSASSAAASSGDTSNATWVQTYPDQDNATWVKTYPDQETASVDINGNTDGAKASPIIDTAMPSCLDINGSEYCTGTDTASSDGSDASSSTPLMRAALPVDTTELTGDEKLACEALLCLSAAAVRPGECAPSLQRLFSIVKKTATRTARARGDFLNMCPKVEDSEELQTQVAAITEGELGSISWNDYVSRYGSPDATSLARSDASPTQTASNNCTMAEDGGGMWCNGNYIPRSDRGVPLNYRCYSENQMCVYDGEPIPPQYEGWQLVDGSFVSPEVIQCGYYGCSQETGTDTTVADGSKSLPNDSDIATLPSEPDVDTNQAYRTILGYEIKRNSGNSYGSEESVWKAEAQRAREFLKNATGPEADAAKAKLQGAAGVTLN